MQKTKYFVKVDGKEFNAEIEANANEITILNELYQVEKIKELAPGVASFKVNDKIVTVEVKASENGIVKIIMDGFTFETEVLDERILLLQSISQKGQSTHRGNVKIKAPMPGLVVKVLATEGDTIDKGTKVVIIEAMKMENVLASPAAGIVQKVYVNEGQTVEKDAILVEIEPR
ncbi:MAG: biotin/lipoyl-containing protein [Candidatus Kapaibacteriota bacterium]